MNLFRCANSTTSQPRLWQAVFGALVLVSSSGALAADDMEAMLAAMGASLPTDSQAKSIDYAPGQLTLRGLVLPEPVLARLREDLGARAYRLQAEGDRLVMRAGAAP